MSASLPGYNAVGRETAPAHADVWRPQTTTCVYSGLRRVCIFHRPVFAVSVWWALFIWGFHARSCLCKNVGRGWKVHLAVRLWDKDVWMHLELFRQSGGAVRKAIMEEVERTETENEQKKRDEMRRISVYIILQSIFKLVPLVYYYLSSKTTQQYLYHLF